MSLKKKSQINCPTCHLECEIELPENLFAVDKRGLIKVKIEEKICCEHQFIVFFNKTGKIMGYEVLDVALLIEEKNLHEISFKEVLKYFGQEILPLIIHALIINIPIIELHKKYAVENKYIKMSYDAERKKFFQLNQFLSKLIPKPPLKYGLEFDLDYNLNPKSEVLLISPSKTVESVPWPAIDLEFEKKLINQTLEVLDEKLQPAFIQGEILKLMNKAEFISNLLSKWAAIYENDILDALNTEFPNEIDENMYQLLLRILERRYNADLSKIKNPNKPKQRRLR